LYVFIENTRRKRRTANSNIFNGPSNNGCHWWQYKWNNNRNTSRKCCGNATRAKSTSEAASYKTTVWWEAKALTKRDK